MCKTLASWELANKRCLKCNHGKFTKKSVPEWSTNPFGYDEDDEEPSLNWSLSD